MKNKQPRGLLLVVMLTLAMVVNTMPAAAIGEVAEEISNIREGIESSAMTPETPDAADADETKPSADETEQQDATSTADKAETPAVSDKAETPAASAKDNGATAASESAPATTAPATESSDQSSLQAQGGDTPELTAQAAYSLDDYITSSSLTVSHDGGKTFVEETTGIKNNDIVRVKLEWKFPNSLRVHAGDTFTCDLPNSPENVLAYSNQTGNIMNGSDVDGYFEIKDNKVTLTYTTDEGSDVAGDISFDGRVDLSRIPHSDGAETDIVFPGSGTTHIVIEPESGSLSSWKEWTQDSVDKNVWHFRVPVKATGTNSHVTMSDSMGALMTLKDGSVRVTTDWAGETAYKGSYTVTGNTAGSNSFTVNIDKMKDETLYVFYDVVADSEKVAWAKEHRTNDDVKNTVTYKSDEDPNPKIATTELSASKTWSVKKSGVANASAKQITWTITISGGSNGDVSLAVIDDDLGKDLASPSSVTAYESRDGKTWSESSWQINWSDLESGKLKVPANSNGIQYRIVYSTSYSNDEAYGQRTYTNKVKVTPDKDPGKPISVEGKVTPTTYPVSVKKTCLTPSSKLSYAPEWRTTVTAKGDVSKLVLVDKPDGNQVIDMSSLVVSTDEKGNNPVDPSLYSVTTTSDSEGVTSFTLTYTGQMKKGDTFYVTCTTKFRASYQGKYEKEKLVIAGTNKMTANANGLADNISSTANYKYTCHITKKFMYDNRSRSGEYYWEIGFDKVDTITTSVSIIDTLPAHQEVMESTVEAFGNGGKSLSGVSVKNNGDGTARFEITGDALAALKSNGIRISYATRWTDSQYFLDGSTKITNKARAIIDGTEEPDITTDGWVDKTKVLVKGSEYNESTAPFVNYTIDVNPTAQTLNQGNPLVLEDVMGSALDLELGTVKIDGKPIDQVDGYSYDYDPATHTMTVTVPDATAFTVTYDARVNLPAGEHLTDANAMNTAALKGTTHPYEGDTTRFNVQVIDPKAHTSSLSESLKIYKYVEREGSTSVSRALGGATFVISELTNVVRDGKSWTSSDDGTYLATVSSGDNGYCHAVDGLRRDVVYRVVETVTPDGFIGSDPIYVVFPGEDAASYDNYEGVTINGVPVLSEGEVQTGTLFVPNTPTDRNAETALAATKTISGRDFRAGDSFTFAVEALNGAPAPVDAKGNAVSSVTVEPKSGSSVSVALGDVKFSTSDLAGASHAADGSRSRTFDYRVTEAKGTQGGMSYDGSVYVAHVTLTEDANFNLHTSVSYEVTRDGAAATATDGISFANSYSASSASVALAGSKVVSNPDGGAGSPTLADIAGAFTFSISSDDADAPLPTDASGKVVTTVSNDASGSVAFPKMTFGAELLGSDWSADGTRTREFVYKIHEGGSYAGLTNDADKTVTVRLTDDGSGAVSASVVRGEGSALDFTFANAYSAREAKAGLSATKTISGRDFRAGDEFTFSAEALGGAPAPAAATKTVAPTSGSSVAVDFGSISFTTDDLAGAKRAADGSRSRTFDYRVTEAKGTQAGMTYDGSVYVAHVTLAEDASGALSTSVSYEVTRDGAAATAADGISFVNSYEASPASFSLEGVKIFNGADKEGFEFSLTGPAVVDGTARETASLANATSSADGSIKFPELTYTYGELRALAAAGYADVTTDAVSTSYTLHFAAAENTEGLKDRGIIGVFTTQLASVTFTDHDGQLSAKVNYGDDDKLTFVNTYSTNDAFIALVGNKVVSNPKGDSKAPNIADIAGAFTFTISSDDADAPLPKDVDGNVVATASNDANGEIAFGAMEFDSSLLPAEWAEDGTRSRDFVYTIHEDGTYGRLHNDKDQTLTLRLVDEGKGSLSVSVVEGEGAVALFDFTFVNTHIPEGTETPKGHNDEDGETPDTPATPGTPSTPSTPETPVFSQSDEPATPSASGFAAEQTVESRLPKTSDPTPTWLGLAAVIGIVLVVVALLVRGRKKK